MAKWILLSTPCLTCLVFLMAAALSRQIRHVPAAAPDPFLAQSAPNGPIDAAGAHDAKSILERMGAALRKVQWLQATIWQRSHDADQGYESEARLVLGPDQCARMETTIRAGAGSCKLLTVSDGRVLAEVMNFPGNPPRVTSSYLPGPETPAAREQIMRRCGCVAPLPLVNELRALAASWRVETGVWRQRRVFRLEATIEPTHLKAGARSCRVYCDAASALPLRLEWYADDHPKQTGLLLEMEYRGLQLDCPLSAEECRRAFTYEANP